MVCVSTRNICSPGEQWRVNSVTVTSFFLSFFLCLVSAILSLVLLFDGAKQITGGARVPLANRDVLQLPIARRRDGRFHLHRREDD